MALVVALGWLSVKAADSLRTAEARQRLRLGSYLAGALLVAHQFSSTAYVTGPFRVGALLLYALAAVMAVRSHRVPGTGRPVLLIATGLDPRALRERLVPQADAAGDIVAVYRADRVTDELRELESRFGLILVVGDEHDPAVKERVSAWAAPARSSTSPSAKWWWPGRAPSSGTWPGRCHALPSRSHRFISKSAMVFRPTIRPV